MADNCQYCGGRLKKLHPAHEVFCSARPGTAGHVKAEMERQMSVTLVTLVTPVVTLDVANESRGDRVKRLARERQQRKRAKA